MTEPILGSFSCPEEDIADGCKTALSCLYPNPSDQNGFLQCDDSGQVYRQKCNPGLVWNDKIKNCDAPSRHGAPHKPKKRPEFLEEERSTGRIEKPTIEEFL